MPCYWGYFSCWRTWRSFVSLHLLLCWVSSTIYCWSYRLSTSLQNYKIIISWAGLHPRFSWTMFVDLSTGQFPPKYYLTPLARQLASVLRDTFSLSSISKAETFRYTIRMESQENLLSREDASSWCAELRLVFWVFRRPLGSDVNYRNYTLS